MPALQLTRGQWLYVLALALAEVEDVTGGGGERKRYRSLRRKNGRKTVNKGGAHRGKR